MESRLLQLIDEIKSEKIKHSIKVDILNNLEYIKSFITSSPGLISPGKVEDKMKDVSGYLKVWIRNSEILEKAEELFKEIKVRYIDLVEEEKPEENSTVVPVISYTIPGYTKKLFKDVELKKGDISYLPIGPSSHYCIIYKILNDTCYLIPMTTTGGHLGEGYDIAKSRFFKGKALYSLYQFPISMVKEKFTIPFDNITELRNIFKGFEDNMRKILPRLRKPSKPYSCKK